LKLSPGTVRLLCNSKEGVLKSDDSDFVRPKFTRAGRPGVIPKFDDEMGAAILYW